jgi:phospholipid/cholesterol/gamma-HCH transport system substrate-binding protein
MGKQITIEPGKDKSVSVDGQRLKGEIRLGLTETVGDQLVPIQEKIRTYNGVMPMF